MIRDSNKFNANRRLWMNMITGIFFSLLVFSCTLSVQGSSPRHDRRHNRAGVAVSTSTITDPPVLTPRFLDRFYQDEDLVIEEKQKPSGWIRQALRSINSESYAGRNDTVVGNFAILRPHNLVASHFVTVVGVGAWLKLAWKQWSVTRLRRRQANATFAAFNETVVPAHVVAALEAYWVEQCDSLRSDRDGLKNQLDATELTRNETQYELWTTQTRYNAAREQLVATEEHVVALTNEMSGLQEQVRARDVELNFTRERQREILDELHAARDQHDVTQKTLDTAIVALNASQENLIRLNESLSISDLRHVEKDELARYWQAQVSDLELKLQLWSKNQTRTEDLMLCLKDSMLAIVKQEQSSLMADFRSRMTKLRSSLSIEDNTTDAKETAYS